MAIDSRESRNETTLFPYTLQGSTCRVEEMNGALEAADRARCQHLLLWKIFHPMVGIFGKNYLSSSLRIFIAIKKTTVSTGVEEF